MMVFKGTIDNMTRSRAYYLRCVRGLSVRKVAEMCTISTASVWRIAMETCANKASSVNLSKRGRKCKLTERQRRQLIRFLRVLRRREGTFTCKRLMEEAGIDQGHVSVRTVTRYLNSAGYFYLQTRKKGLMSEEDHIKRRLSL